MRAIVDVGAYAASPVGVAATVRLVPETRDEAEILVKLMIPVMTSIHDAGQHRAKKVAVYREGAHNEFEFGILAPDDTDVPDLTINLFA